MYAFYMWMIKTKQYTFAETWHVAVVVVIASIILAWLCLRFYDIPIRKWLTSKTKSCKSKNKTE